MAETIITSAALTPEDHIKALLKHQEATTALVVAALVEEWLQKLLLLATRPISGKMATKIYEAYGPLNTFSAKIDIAYLFKQFDDDIYGDLRAIKDIRNKFAHTTDFISFTSEHIANECQRLTGWIKGNNNRILYEKRCVACVYYFMGRVARITADAARPAAPEPSP
jgi:DNA-binding MltR family transcriptional regulator